MYTHKTGIYARFEDDFSIDWFLLYIHVYSHAIVHASVERTFLIVRCLFCLWERGPVSGIL